MIHMRNICSYRRYKENHRVIQGKVGPHSTSRFSSDSYSTGITNGDARAPFSAGARNEDGASIWREIEREGNGVKGGTSERDSVTRMAEREGRRREDGYTPPTHLCVVVQRVRNLRVTLPNLLVFTRQ